MKKVFISVPMKGRSNEAIKNSIEKMHKIAELMFGEELEPVCGICDDHLPDDINIKYPAVYYLGKALEKMSTVDYFIGVNYSYEFTGCNIESNVAFAYDINTILLDIRKFACFNDIKHINEDEAHECLKSSVF